MESLEININELSQIPVPKLKELYTKFMNERKRRMKEYINPIKKQHLTPLQNQYIKPLMIKHIHPINEILRAIKQHIPKENTNQTANEQEEDPMVYLILNGEKIGPNKRSYFLKLLVAAN